jgi:hypothetical protein
MAKAPKPSVTVTVEGLSELRARLARFEKELLPQITAVNREAAQDVKAAALERVPRRSGRLAKSIKATASRTRGLVRAGGDLVPYAGVISFGWPAHDIAPQPFLLDALDARRETIVELYAKRIESLSEEVHGG